MRDHDEPYLVFECVDHGDGVEDGHAEDGYGEEDVEHVFLAYESFYGWDERHEDEGWDGAEPHEECHILFGVDVVDHVVGAGGVAYGHHGEGRDEEEGYDSERSVVDELHPQVGDLDIGGFGAIHDDAFAAL